MSPTLLPMNWTVWTLWKTGITLSLSLSLSLLDIPSWKSLLEIDYFGSFKSYWEPGNDNKRRREISRHIKWTTTITMVVDFLSIIITDRGFITVPLSEMLISGTRPPVGCLATPTASRPASPSPALQTARPPAALSYRAATPSPAPPSSPPSATTPPGAREEVLTANWTGSTLPSPISNLYTVYSQFINAIKIMEWWLKNVELTSSRASLSLCPVHPPPTHPPPTTTTLDDSCRACHRILVYC